MDAGDQLKEAVRNKELALAELHDAAGKLEHAASIVRQDVKFPGWDYEGAQDYTMLHRFDSIRDAAWAILNNTYCDSSVSVNLRSVAMLLKYVADMIEVS